MIKPDAVQHFGKILDLVYRNGFRVAKLKMTRLSLAEAQEFYAVHKVGGVEGSRGCVCVLVMAHAAGRY